MPEEDEKKLKPANVEAKTSNKFLNVKPKTPYGTNQLLYISLSENLKDKYNTRDKYITKEEVAKHNKEDDAWIIYKNKVYDITLYLKYHPGGKKILLNQSGKDITEFVLKFHPWVNVEEILKHTLIGYIEC
ncbi:cytochrome b5-like heme/steroid binding protein, putative [Plasmodium gallinaceum]|uniref:Cytochrome b5-like heme/steroid binding protein, putative n=1 Tax=Plasmodium gallinaceum TaxID=5849 RepID=A0A1J1GZK6_PLAGA|nr:cytochrome b5-like heme/steroid binding protein, putative [Plasmodium gallinaceum]CRG96729.1 cytochrome b5-like heme/steroid binding protein, putative [Plasmodium gallinaceum]